MKKMNLTRKLMAACSIVALSAVMYGCGGGGDDPEPMVEMPEPMPEPVEPPGPTDLEETQTAAAAAADAAKTASDNAATAASDAATATMHIATLQTNGKAADYATAADTAAGDAADAYADAKAASDAAAAATTGDAVEADWRDAVTAQEAAEAAAMTAGEMAEKAAEAAMTELHIDGTMKMAAGSMVDADADTSTSPAGDRITGFLNNVSRAADAVPGQPFVEATGQTYIQSVAARDVKIGKTLDTSDDTARLTVIHSRAGSELARVYVVNDAADTTVMDSGDGILIGDVDGDPLTLNDNTYAPLKALGPHYEAADVQAGGTPADDGADEDNVIADGNFENGLDFSDQVAADTEPKDLFSYVDGGETIHVVETARTINAVTGITTVTYQHVDTLAQAAPDGHGAALDDRIAALAPDDDEVPESIAVKASIPVAVAYSHIHFGIWAGLDAAEKDGSQKYADLGIGFVQGLPDGDGPTDRLGIGTVTYNGDWVATVQRQNATAGTGAIILDDGDAELVANFDTEKFTGTLDGLATLTGTLDGNGFSGITATDIDHADLDASGDFKGEFSGGIYGDKGEEAAGVFDFNGGEAGAFVGAFGGTNQD